MLVRAEPPADASVAVRTAPTVLAWAVGFCTWISAPGKLRFPVSAPVLGSLPCELSSLMTLRRIVNFVCLAFFLL